MIKSFQRIGLIVQCILIVQGLYAQNCGCKFTIQPYQVYIDNDSLGAKPGDVVCIAASNKKYLGLKNFHGTPGNPIIFKNCGGQVVMGGQGWYYAMRMDNCTYFNLTGTGDPNYQYGFKTIDTPDGTMGMLIDGLSTDCEVDHVEIANSGFAGIMAKSDPDCTGRPNRGNFVMKNVSIHDNYIHGTKGEGMYIGFPHYTGMIRICDVDTIRVFPHDIVGLKIFNNIVESTGREGIQVGCATSEVYIYDNKVTNFGTLNQNYNNSGVHFCTGAVCQFYSNIIQGGTGPGMWLNGLGDNYIYNNLFTDMGGDGIMMHDTTVAEGRGYHILNNTFVNGSGTGIMAYTFRKTKMTFSNNLFAGFGGFYSFPTGDITYANNLYSKAVKPFHFEDPNSGNYHLKATSPAVDGGVDLAYLGVTVDLEYTPRPKAKAYDVGAFESPYERIYDEYIIYPNPIHAIAHIRFVVLDDTKGSLKVVDEWGQVVAVIAEGQFEAGKRYEYKFNSLFLAHGIYYYVLQTEDEKKVIKVLKVE